MLLEAACFWISDVSQRAAMFFEDQYVKRVDGERKILVPLFEFQNLDIEWRANNRGLEWDPALLSEKKKRSKKVTKKTKKKK